MLTDTEEARLRRAVAYFLYIESMDLPEDESGLYRATALSLIGEPVDAALLREAGKHKSKDDPLYSNRIRAQPEIADLWEQQQHAT
ncbi:MAG TPA: hypothetical protein VGH13_08060 [Xanthobacteraceae bacterium]|jgi:hypothetical protein